MACLKWKTNRDLLHSAGSSGRRCGATCVQGDSGRMGTWICVAESPHCPPENVKSLLLGYTPVQRKKVFLTPIFTVYTPHRLKAL